MLLYHALNYAESHTLGMPIITGPLRTLVWLCLYTIMYLKIVVERSKHRTHSMQGIGMFNTLFYLLLCTLGMHQDRHQVSRESQCFCVFTLHCYQGRSQDFRKEGAKMSSDCARSAQNWRAGSHAHPLNHVGAGYSICNVDSLDANPRSALARS